MRKNKKKPDIGQILAGMYIELESIEHAIDRSMWTVETRRLRQREVELLGAIKKLER